MAFCEKCGIQVNDEVKFCPSCGAPVNKQEESNQDAKAGDFTAKIQDLNQTADTTAKHDQKDIADNKTMAVFAYFGPLVLVPILAAPKSKFARFHANQGLLILIGEIVYGVVQSVLLKVLRTIFPWDWTIGYLGGRGMVYNILSSALSIIWIVFGILAILGVLNALKGKAKELPIIGKIRIIK